VFLYGLISSPISDIPQLKARQDIIKFFVNNEEASSELQDIYQQFATSENMLLSLWAQDGFLHSTQRHYYSIPLLHNLNEQLNRSTIALELKSIWDHHQRAMFLASGVFAAIILPIYAFSKATDTPLPTILERSAERLQGSGGKILALISSLSEHKLFTAGVAGVAGAACALATKEDYEWARDNVTLDSCLQKKMIIISNFLRNITTLAKLIESNPEFIDICPAAGRINDFMQNDFYEADMQELFAFCMSETLQGEPSIFSLQGRVLAAFKLVYDLKDKLEPVLMAIGEIDAYFACACLYNEFKDKRVQFCFTEFKDDINPSIEMKNFWNPFINPAKVVSNDLNLQGPDRRNMIITGPNAGGKSTLIKAVPINLILSQSIGLTAASYAEITPFYSIATYLNIVDDIAAGNSLFKAQVLRAQEMINLVEQTPNNKFSFVALDEMFNGTSAKESMAAAYSVVKHIGQYPNNISIVATHFPLLTNLEGEISAFANYKVSVEVDDKKGIYYPFKLEHGSSTQHVALDILRQEGYDCTILAEATEILKTASI
jgi:DNA mismatch repair protein MutS